MAEQVINLQAARGRLTSPAAAARRRLSAARTATGLTPAPFAARLTAALGWPVTAEAVTVWESTAAVPPGDVLTAAEAIAGVMPLPPEEPAQAMRLVDSYGDVQAELARVVDEAETVLSITGSRSRDPNYLARIEAATGRPGLVHTRVLYGPPRHGALKNHLMRLVDLGRDPDVLRIGMLPDLMRDGERFIAANDRTVVLVLPSLHSLHNFDTALIIDDPEIAGQYVTHVQQAWLSSDQLRTRADVERLEVQR